MTIHDIIKLSELLGEMGQIKRGTNLPDGTPEPDSHHAFSLALIAYQIILTDCPELDASKVLLFALAHDLLEVITGDVDTLHFTPEQHAAKQAQEEKALDEFDIVFAQYPALKQAMYDYEKLDTSEAATVFVLDKACTTWTHHPDNAAYIRTRGVESKNDVEAWGERQRQKFHNRLKVMPPQKILDIYEQSFEALKDLFEYID